MKKMNSKGVTLVELIVSFAIVGVAIIYFFQTLYTVKTIYSTAKNDTQEFVDKDYALRIVDAYIDSKGYSGLTNVCSSYGLGCSGITKTGSAGNINKIVIEKDGTTWITLYKYQKTS